MSHLFRKNSKISAFFDEIWPENHFWQKLLQHAAQLNAAPSINAKNYHFEAYCEDRTQKYNVCSLKNQKTEILIAKKSPKKFWASESFENDRS